MPPARAALVAIVLAVAAVRSTHAEGYFVANCSECSTIVETTGDVAATCEESDDFPGGFECECYRPYMNNWEITANGTVQGIDGGPLCKHAFAYSVGLLILQYLPDLPILLVIVYASKIIKNKATMMRSHSNSDLSAAAAAEAAEAVKAKNTCECTYNQLIGASLLIIIAAVFRIVYISVDPQGYFEILPAAVNVVCLRIGFQLNWISIFIVMDRCVRKTFFPTAMLM